MYLQYRNYRHDNNECQIVVTKDPVFSEAGRKSMLRVRMDVMGEIFEDNVSTITSKLQALEEAYRYDYGDVWLYTDSGQRTAHGTNNGNTINGVRVASPPNYPKGDGVEYAAGRTYTLALEWEEVARGPALLAWAETFSIQGDGGPDWRYFVPLEGIPQPQVLSQRSVVTMTQSGYAVGRGAYPLPSAPLYPAYMHGPSRRRDPELPSAGSIERRISWSYTFFLLSAPAATPKIPSSWNQ
jgi:hypothetical protein